MIFCDQFDKFDLEQADELLRNWQRWGRVKQFQYISPTWIVMRSIRNHSKRAIKEEEAGFAERRDIPEIDEKLAQQVEALLTNKEKWWAHHYERQTLCRWYDYRLRDGASKYILERKFKCSLRDAERQVIEALRYFNELWRTVTNVTH